MVAQRVPRNGLSFTKNYHNFIIVSTSDVFDMVVKLSYLMLLLTAPSGGCSQVSEQRPRRRFSLTQVCGLTMVFPKVITRSPFTGRMRITNRSIAWLLSKRSHSSARGLHVGVNFDHGSCCRRIEHQLYHPAQRKKHRFINLVLNLFLLKILVITHDA
jgi:hypothetical protein